MGAAFPALAAACAPFIHFDTISTIVSVESSLNPFAIAVVRPHIPYKNPRNREEAMALIARLEQMGANYSVGLGQINSANFERFGLSAADLIDPCVNLAAAQKVLSECYARFGRLNHALSCYYSGNPRAGYRLEKDGTSYVQRVHARFSKLKANPKVFVPSIAYEPAPPVGSLPMTSPSKSNAKPSRKTEKKTPIFKLKYARF